MIGFYQKLPKVGLDTLYNGSVDIYANSPTSDTAYFIGTATLSGGYGTSSWLRITSVLGTGSGRKITVVDSDGRQGSTTVGVWFQGDATYFDGSTGTYCEGTGYGAPPSYYVALPAYGLCTESVVVNNPHTGISKTAQVWDVGPFFDANHCGADEYWSKGTIPLAQQYDGKRRCDACNTDCNQDKKIINGAIIDLSPELMNALGGSGTITNGLWRFT